MLDIYGHPLNLNLDGSEVYRTKLGAMVTLLTYVLIIFNFV